MVPITNAELDEKNDSDGGQEPAKKMHKREQGDQEMGENTRTKRGALETEGREAGRKICDEFMQHPERCWGQHLLFDESVDAHGA